VGVEKVPQSFDNSLKHRLNALSTSAHNDGHVTNKQAAEITQLYHNLDEYDKKALAFAPRWKKSKGRFLKKKSSGHIGTEAMAKYKLNNIGGKGKKIHSNNKKINN
jgi:hypothetical protein